MPLVTDVMVFVSENELTVDRVGDVVEDLKRIAGVGELQAGRCRARWLSWATTEAMPPAKSMPITWSFGSGVVEFGSGRTDGSSTRTMLIGCWTLDASV